MDVLRAYRRYSLLRSLFQHMLQEEGVFTAALIQTALQPFAPVPAFLEGHA